MYVLSIPKLKKNYRILIDKKGRLVSVEIDEKEAKIKLAKIKNKTLVKKQIQLNLSDGRNILAEKPESKVGDTLVFEIPSQKIISSLKFEKGAIICLFAGKHAGQIGKVEDIKENKLIFKNNAGQNIETLKGYAFVIGKEKPLIKIIENEH
jgi:small subunit ribosomal protein S4e